ncbi:unnamed protein product [Arctogadus glacialis]
MTSEPADPMETVWARVLTPCPPPLHGGVCVAPVCFLVVSGSPESWTWNGARADFSQREEGRHHTNEKHEKWFQGLIKYSDCTHWEQLRAVFPNREINLSVLPHSPAACNSTSQSSCRALDPTNTRYIPTLTLSGQLKPFNGNVNSIKKEPYTVKKTGLPSAAALRVLLESCHLPIAVGIINPQTGQ